MEEHDIQQRLAEFIERETEYWDFWGAIRIVKDGETFWETSRGYSCAEFGVKNTMTTRFTIASVTKQFTAFAIMLLYDRGQYRRNHRLRCFVKAQSQVGGGRRILLVICFCTAEQTIFSETATNESKEDNHELRKESSVSASAERRYDAGNTGGKTERQPPDDLKMGNGCGKSGNG